VFETKVLKVVSSIKAAIGEIQCKIIMATVAMKCILQVPAKSDDLDCIE
jgi:hypothetical protein